MAVQMAAQSLLVPLLSFVGGLAGGIFGGYISKRGEIRAVHAELTKVIEQNKAITTVTEQIKAGISTAAWTRQLRKEACYEMLKQIPTMSEALALLVARCIGGPSQDTNAEVNFALSYKKYLESEIIVSTVCGKNLQPARQALTAAIMNVNRAVGRNDAVGAQKQFAHVANSCEEFSRACREELRVDAE
jgi:hypothetical protein